MKDNKNLVIGILVGIIICLIAIFVLYFTGVLKLNGGNNNSNNSNNNTINENTKESEKAKEIFYSFKVENMHNSANPEPFEKKVDVNGKTVLLTYNDNNNIFSINSKEYGNVLVSNFYIYKDLVFVRVSTSEGGEYKIYDLSGNLIKEIDINTNKYVNAYGELSFSNNILLVEAENNFPYIDENHYICGCGQCSGSPSTDEYKDVIDNSKYFSKAKYQIIYKKDTKNIDLKLYEVTETVKQYLEKIGGKSCVVKREG